MLSTDITRRPTVRAWVLAQRFQKFLAVGAIGLVVNQTILFLLAGASDLRLSLASPVAIVTSMAVTFALNEVWTWHDRGGGRIVTRLLLYATVNSGGLAINTGVLLFMTREHAVHYLFANLVGAGIAAVWNFGLNHLITWRA